MGSVLIDHCVIKCKELNMKSIKLEVYQSNLAAISFYEKNGFQIVGNASEVSIYLSKVI